MDNPARGVSDGPRLFTSVLILVLVLAGAGFTWYTLNTAHSSKVGYELAAVSTLQYLHGIQDHFRNNDADEDGVRAYWRQDVAGLYTTKDKKGPLKRIEPTLAGADYFQKCDLTPYAKRASKARYWYRALRFPDEKNPDPNRFAISAFPDGTSERARNTFIIAQDNVVYFKVLEKPEAMAEYPADPAKEGWSRR